MYRVDIYYPNGALEKEYYGADPDDLHVKKGYEHIDCFRIGVHNPFRYYWNGSKWVEYEEFLIDELCHKCDYHIYEKTKQIVGFFRCPNCDYEHYYYSQNIQE
jgi:hypothetical protein